MNLNNEFTKLINSMTNKQLSILTIMLIKNTNYKIFEDDVFLKKVIELGELIKKV